MLVWLEHVLDACPCTALGSWHQAVMLGPVRSRQPQGTSSLARLPLCCLILHTYMGTAFCLTHCVSIDVRLMRLLVAGLQSNQQGAQQAVQWKKPFSVIKQLNQK